MQLKDCEFYSVIILNQHLYMIGVWLGEDQRTNITKTHI